MLAELRHGPRPGSDYQPGHTCENGDKGCSTPAHIVWKKGWRNCGAGHYTTNLAEEDVLMIRKLAGYITHREIGAMYGISKVAVSYIVTRRSWKHLL